MWKWIYWLAIILSSSPSIWHSLSVHLRWPRILQIVRKEKMIPIPLFLIILMPHNIRIDPVPPTLRSTACKMQILTDIELCVYCYNSSWVTAAAVMIMVRGSFGNEMHSWSSSSSCAGHLPRSPTKVCNFMNKHNNDLLAVGLSKRSEMHSMAPQSECVLRERRRRGDKWKPCQTYTSSSNFSLFALWHFHLSGPDSDDHNCMANSWIILAEHHSLIIWVYYYAMSLCRGASEVEIIKSASDGPPPRKSFHSKHMTVFFVPIPRREFSATHFFTRGPFFFGY